jgi:hypothetical protein
MTSWEQLSRKDQLAATHYDFYKDVHGIRPRWFNYDEMTEAELEAALDQLGKESEIQAKIEAEAEAIATDKVEARIADLIQSGAKTREVAVKWILEAEGADQDAEYGCFLLGLPYGYFKEIQ